MRKKVKMGRPLKPEEDKLVKQVNVRMTQVERERLNAECERQGISLSALLMKPWRTQDKTSLSKG